MAEGKSEDQHPVCPPDAMQRHAVGTEMVGVEHAFKHVVVRFMVMPVKDAAYLHGTGQIIDGMESMLVA